MCDCSNKELTPIYREIFVRDASIALMSQVYLALLGEESTYGKLDWKIEAEVVVGVAEALWQVFAERMQNPTQWP